MNTISTMFHSRSLILSLSSIVVASAMMPEAFALPIDRMAGRAGARHSRQNGREDARDERREGDYADARGERQEGRQGARISRTTGRVVSRSRFRGCYVLPRGAVVFPFGGYRYYRVGPRFYYPYMYGGRTVYIDINVVAGNPAPPPPAGSIDIDIDIN